MNKRQRKKKDGEIIIWKGATCGMTTELINNLKRYDETEQEFKLRMTGKR